MAPSVKAPVSEKKREQPTDRNFDEGDTSSLKVVWGWQLYMTVTFVTAKAHLQQDG